MPTCQKKERKNATNKKYCAISKVRYMFGKVRILPPIQLILLSLEISWSLKAHKICFMILRYNTRRFHVKRHHQRQRRTKKKERKARFIVVVRERRFQNAMMGFRTENKLSRWYCAAAHLPPMPKMCCNAISEYYPHTTAPYSNVLSI